MFVGLHRCNCCTAAVAAHLSPVQLPQDRENRLAHQRPGSHLRAGPSAVSVPVVANVVVPLNVRIKSVAQAVGGVGGAGAGRMYSSHEWP